MKIGDFFGHQTVVLENQFFRIECLADAGPRIVRLIPQWTGENLFAELPRTNLQTARGEYRFYGGHRLWTAPESFARSYIPDNGEVDIKEVTGGIRLSGKPEFAGEIRKTMTIQMSSSQSFVIVKHKIENTSTSPIRLAPWAITMMRTKGVAVLPQQMGNIDDEGLLPNRRLSLWSYTRLNDPRLRLGDDFITVKTDSFANPLKLGYFNPHGWLGYVYDDVIFVKRFGVRRDEDYPDFGCNAEVYVNDRTLELESLGPLIELGPNLNVVHTETWEVYSIDSLPKNLLGERSLDEILAR